MLAGDQAEAATDVVTAGCERLWQLVIAPGPADAPVGKFAREYIRRHHPDIGQQLNDKPVDAGAEIPPSFLTLDRVYPLFAESRKPLRDFALELAKWEFARWNPGVDQLVGLADRSKHKPNELSGGQQQRVAIARAIVSDPTLLVCDEPTGDLDRENAEEIMNLLKALNRSQGKTIVMVTHDPRAAEYATRELHLDKGRLSREEVRHVA